MSMSRELDARRQAALNNFIEAMKPRPLPRWCRCASEVGGFRHAGDGLWVHARCGKPTKMFLEAYELKRGRG